MSKALIVVDCQIDFCEGGSLPVTGGNAACEKIAAGPMQDPQYDIVIVSKDHHVHGDDNGGHISDDPDYISTWPSHCVQGTQGNRLHPTIREAYHQNFPRMNMVFKGQGRPAYSVFEGQDTFGVSTDQLLKRSDITDLTVVGIATDYCVKATAIDARLRKYNVEVPLDHTAAVANDTATKAIEDMRRQGVHIL